MEGILDDLKKSSREPRGTSNKSTGTFEVGYVTDDRSQIHLGRDVWLPIQTFAFVTANVKSVSGLTRNLVSALFDERTLLKSTISGKASNKVTKSRTHASLKENVEKLDPVKVMAIKDFVRYYLVDEWKLSEDIADTEADLVRHHISKKIADMKEATNLINKQKKNTKKSSSSIMNIVENANNTINNSDGGTTNHCTDDIEELCDINPFNNNVEVIEFVKTNLLPEERDSLDQHQNDIQNMKASDNSTL